MRNPNVVWASFMFVLFCATVGILCLVALLVYAFCVNDSAAQKVTTHEGAEAELTRFAGPEFTECILKAFSLVVLDEINVLRDKAHMDPRTVAQLKAAMRAKLEAMT